MISSRESNQSNLRETLEALGITEADSLNNLEELQAQGIDVKAALAMDEKTFRETVFNPNFEEAAKLRGGIDLEEAANKSNRAIRVLHELQRARFILTSNYMRDVCVIAVAEAESSGRPIGDVESRIAPYGKSPRPALPLEKALEARQEFLPIKRQKPEWFNDNPNQQQSNASTLSAKISKFISSITKLLSPGTFNASIEKHVAKTPAQHAITQELKRYESENMSTRPPTEKIKAEMDEIRECFTEQKQNHNINPN